MISCKDLVKKIHHEENLGFFKRVEVYMHLLACRHCSNYVKHLKLMKLEFKKLFSKITQVEESKIKTLEQKIINKNQ